MVSVLLNVFLKFMAFVCMVFSAYNSLFVLFLVPITVCYYCF